MYYRGLRFLDLTQLTETKEDPSPNSNGNGNSTLPNSTPLRVALYQKLQNYLWE